MSDALVTRVELGRLPFRRRPIAEPGTRLVLQLANGTLVCPDHPYTTGETWFRGPKAAYVVDTGMHEASFESELPSAAPAVYFTATVSYRWQVHDPARIIQNSVTDPPAESRAHLEHRLPDITCRFPPDRTLDATRAVQDRMGRAPIDLERGLRITGLHVVLRMDAEQAVLAEQHRTLEAIKVLIDGGEVRLGELDGAVRGAVQRLSVMMGVTTEPPAGELGGGVATDSARALPEQPDGGQGDPR